MNLFDQNEKISDGTELRFDFQTDPFYYHASAFNPFVFFCEYIGPIGRVDLKFPDNACGPLSLLSSYSGESFFLIELVTSEIYSFFSGEALSLSLDTSILLGFKEVTTGETTQVTLSPTQTLPLLGYSGAVLTCSVSTPVFQTFELSSHSGESTSFDLSTSTSLGSISFFEGCSSPLRNDVIDVIPNSTFTNFSGSSSHSETSSCLTLNSARANSGINASFAFSYFFTEKTIVRFKRTRANWYNDSFSDAALSICLFPGYLPSEIYWDIGSYSYNQPRFIAAQGSLNEKAFSIDFRYGLGSPCRVRWNQSSSVSVSNLLTVVSPFILNEVAGVSETIIEILDNVTSTTVNIYGENKELRQTGTFANIVSPWATQRSKVNNTFLIHYHNYNTSADEILCNIQLSLCESFIISPFVFLNFDATKTGEVNSFDLSTESHLSLFFYSGDFKTVDLLSHPSFGMGIFSAYTGERLQYVLETSEVFKIYSGEYTDLTLSTQALNRAQLDVVFGTGESFVSSISVSRTLSSNSSVGETLSLDLSVAPSIPLGIVTFRDGSCGIVEYRLEANLSNNCYTGEYFSYSLTIAESSPIGIVNVRVGESVSSLLSTEMILSVDSWSGESLSPIITFRPQVQLALSGYSGNRLSVQGVSLATSFSFRFYQGSSSDVGLTTYASSAMLFTCYAGESTYLFPQLASSLTFQSAITGERAQIGSIAFEPNYMGYVGERGEFSLSTSSIIHPNTNVGEIANFELETHPPFSIGNFNARAGETASSVLWTLRSAHLFVSFNNGISTQLDIGSTTYFDLSTDKCCGIRTRSASLNIEMTNGLAPAEQTSGSRIKFEIDIATRPRLSFNFKTGETFKLEDRSVYLEFSTFDSLSAFTLNFETLDLRHRLCKGYFIPNGNWLVVELNDILDENCKTNRCWTGESFQCEMSLSHTFPINSLISGETMTFDIRVYEPWRLYAYNGQYVLIDFPLEAKHKHQTGETMFIRFYEPDFIGKTGEYASIDQLVTSYEVAFLEEGCLDNEFVYQNKDGDLIPELTNPVPVEGEPYTHSIRAKCS